MPVQSGIHDTYKSGLGRNIGTAAHVGYLHQIMSLRQKCVLYDAMRWQLSLYRLSRVLAAYNK